MNTQPYPVATAEQRSWRYWFSDGLPNLVAGLTCFLVSLAFIWLAEHRHQHSPIFFGLLIAAFGLLAFVFARFPQTLERLKERITYPRTGYVAPPYFTETPSAPADLVMLNLSGVRQQETTRPMLESEDLRWRIWVTLPIFLAEPFAGKYISNHWLCGAAGLAAGILVLLFTRNDPRKAWAVVFALLLVQIYSLNLGSLQIEGAGFFQAGVGLALTLAGAFTLVRYLKENRVKHA